jgi:tetratricopeptide (TPR) repeat protein
METTATIMRMQLRFYQTGSADGGTDAISEVQALLPVLEGDANHEGLARAWRLLTMIGFGIGRYVFTEHAAERAIEHARLAEDRLIETRSRSSLAMCALLGQTPVPQAIERCEELLVQAEGDRKSESLILAVLAHLEAMRGNPERARDLYRRSRATLEELGVKLLAALTSLDSGWVEMIAGDPVAAERELRGDYETLNAMGERMYISTTSASLSEALYRQGRYDEAQAMTTFSQEIAAPDDVSTQFLWRHVRAKVLARRGDCAEAVILATESVRLIGESDDIESQGNALMSLAEVFCLCGRRREAADAAEQARERFQRKGNVVSATLATSFRQSLEAGLPSAIALEPLHFRPAIQ